MKDSDLNKQTRVVWTRSDSKCKDASDLHQSDNANIIPFPAIPAARKQPVTGRTGALLSRLSLRQVLRMTRERVLNHIRKPRKPARGQCNGKYNESVNAARRATG